MRRKKNLANFNQSEPAFLISCLDRHLDWAVIVCLVGGGQEINTGEAGISEWINALNRSFPNLRSFPDDVRREIGKAIFDLQKGAKLSMPLSRPMPSVAAGVEELRIKDRSGAYRVFYCLKTETAVLIFHAFQKKTPAPQEIKLARARLKEML